MRPLEFETEILAITGASVVQRTPSEPDFRFGNRMIFNKPPTSAEATTTELREQRRK